MKTILYLAIVEYGWIIILLSYAIIPILTYNDIDKVIACIIRNKFIIAIGILLAIIAVRLQLIKSSISLLFKIALGLNITYYMIRSLDKKDI